MPPHTVAYLLDALYITSPCLLLSAKPGGVPSPDISHLKAESAGYQESFTHDVQSISTSLIVAVVTVLLGVTQDSGTSY